MSAFDEGFEAKQRGEPLTANPYAGRTDMHIDWHRGWLDLHEHLTSRDAAWEFTFGERW